MENKVTLKSNHTKLNIPLKQHFNVIVIFTFPCLLLTRGFCMFSLSDCLLPAVCAALVPLPTKYYVVN